MLNWVLIQIIKLYQKIISPIMIPSCRFHPSCSEYSVQALKRHNLLRALQRIVCRLAKCHPYHEGGADPLK